MLLGVGVPEAACCTSCFSAAVQFVTEHHNSRLQPDVLLAPPEAVLSGFWEH